LVYSRRIGYICSLQSTVSKFVALAEREKVGETQGVAYGYSPLPSPGQSPLASPTGTVTTGRPLPKTPGKVSSPSGVANAGGDGYFPTAPGATSPSSPSSQSRKPSTASNALSTRSFEFAPHRSPLQKLELELKHISQEEADAPQLGRSLSKKQEERLQRSTTVASRLTSPGGATASSASARGHPKIEEDSSQHTETDTKHHHHRHKITEMLGHHSKHKDGLEERKKQEGKKKQDEKGSHHDTPSRTGELDEPQTVCQTPPKNPALISGNDRVGRKGGRHSHHGNPFQHIRRGDGTAGSLGGVRATQALGGEGVFDPRVVHLTLEDMELNDIAVQSNDTAEDSDGMASLSYKGRFSSISLVFLLR